MTKLTFIDDNDDEVETLLVMDPPKSFNKTKMVVKTVGVVITILAVAFIVWAHCGYSDGSPSEVIVVNDGASCGGVLEADYGLLTYSTIFEEEKAEKICIWIIKIYAAPSIQFILKNLDTASQVSVYPDPKSGQDFFGSMKNSKFSKPKDKHSVVPVKQKLFASDINSTLQFPGQTLIIVMTRQGSSGEDGIISFSWSGMMGEPPRDTNLETKNMGSGRLIYLEGDQGRSDWIDSMVTVTWVLNQNSALGMKKMAAVSVDATIQNEQCKVTDKDPCWCAYFGLYEVTSDGPLREVNSVCNGTLTFKASQLSSHLVGFLFHRNSDEVTSSSLADRVTIEWTMTSHPEPLPMTTTINHGQRTTKQEDTTMKMTTDTTESPPDQLQCPPPDHLLPCECKIYSDSGPWLTCEGPNVTNNKISLAVSLLRTTNNVGSNAWLHLTEFTINRTNMARLDLTPFVMTRISGLLAILGNNHLEEINGDHRLSENGHDGLLIAAHSIQISYNYRLSDEGLATTLKIFDPTHVTKLFFSNNKIRCPDLNRKIDDDNNNYDDYYDSDAQFPEILPGLSLFKNLEVLDLGYNQIESLGQGQFKMFRRLAMINFESNFLIELGHDSLRFAQFQDIRFIYLGRNKLNDSNVHVDSGLGSMTMETMVDLSGNEFEFISELNFGPFLRANMANQLNFAPFHPYLTRFVCDERMRWLKKEREQFEHRVLDVECSNDPGLTIFTTSLVE